MLTRVIFLFQQTTAPDDRTAAQPRTGGWSEGFWAQGVVPIGATGVDRLATKRARMLPAQAAIVGIRAAQYDISGNKVLPKGASTAKVNYPGDATLVCDIPQMAMEMAGTATGAVNASRFCIRGFPDIEVKGGEYTPDDIFKGKMTQYCNEVANGGWGFIGRDLTQAAQRVMKIVGNVVTLQAPIAAVVGQDYLIFRRCYDSSGNPVTGSFLITAMAGADVTLGAFPNRTLTVPSGTARVDKIVYCDFDTVAPARIVARKVGRPFASYRGRQSKKR